jgi:hypothetical protein
MSYHTSQLLVIQNILLLFWNNLRSLIFTFGGLECDMWCNINFPCGILIENFQIKLKSIFRYVS